MIILKAELSTSKTVHDPESDLIQRIAAGDEDALQALVAACGQRLYAYALRLTGDPAAAEEVLQDSLVAVWQGARRFRRESRAIAWLLGIVHNKALNSLRLRRRILARLDEDQDLPAAPGPLPETQTALNERRRLLGSAIARLSLEHRTVLELVFYQGLSLEETAGVTGCPLGTVKSRLNYAKASLRGVLSRTGLDEEDLRT
jgi:RNA polymerase sigma-70 factor (ECF subfamily)